MSTDTTPEKRDWKRIVAESQGRRFFVPGKLVDDFKVIELKRKELIEHLEKTAELDIRQQVRTNDAILKAREIIEKETGLKFWQKLCGIDEEALKDGQFILNFTDN